MKINDDKLDEFFADQRKQFEMMCQRYKEDINMKFNNIIENGNAIIKTLGVISGDMKIILCDLRYIKDMMK